MCVRMYIAEKCSVHSVFKHYPVQIHSCKLSMLMVQMSFTNCRVSVMSYMEGR